MAHAVTMIVALTVKLSITERVRNALPETQTTRDAKTNVKIVDLLKAGLAETKQCKNEQQRIQYLIGLSYVMPARVEPADSNGWNKRMCDWFEARRGKRTATEGARQFASDQATAIRAQFDVDVELQTQLLQVGDIVVSHSDICELTGIGDTCQNAVKEGPSCVLTFRVGDVAEECAYQSMYGKQAGSAQLQRRPPSLLLPPRALNSLAVSEETRANVKSHAFEVCAESPCKPDMTHMHVGTHVWES